ncbi:hypothetical protein RN001_000480 [Aquatica leii]|uniref:Gustatory receptor n=1 Tax=Aquatica leii TaxID=1421715 RepID=A0AAN7Q309_9COLE|nr:hypothetical protein RN001_000480 [Aquatica leii]
MNLKQLRTVIPQLLIDKNIQTQNVYSLYKPVYIITKLLCLASFTLHHSKNNSKKMYYALQVVFVCFMVYLTVLSYADKMVLKSFGNSTIIVYINRVLSILLLIVTIITFLTSHVHARYIPKILKTIRTLDKVISKRKYQIPTRFKLFNIILLLLYTFFFQLLVGEIVLDLYLKSQVSIDKIFRCLCRILSAATILQYATILNLLYWRFVIVNNLIKLIKLNDEDQTIFELKLCSTILQQLYDICKRINTIFGIFLASVLFVIFTEYLETMFAFLATYWMLGIKIVDRPRIEELGFWEITINNFLATILHCYVVFFFADLIHKEVNRTNDVLEELHLRSYFCSKVLKTICQLYHQINHNKFVFTAGKFIDLGWHQAFMMFGGVISYSIVSSQLYLNVKQKEFDLPAVSIPSLLCVRVFKTFV